MNSHKQTCLRICVLALLFLPAIPPALNAQGNVFGTVQNSDASTPADGDISFFGYLENTDEEIRIDSCVGAGYDNGHWLDDFQNYMTESIGDQFSYHFYNSLNGEGFLLVSLIEIGSFQQEDIILSLINWPAAPTGLAGKAVTGPAVELSWETEADHSYHIYRRHADSDGSFFRIDDPAGLMTNPGVNGSPYIDYAVDGQSQYDYIIIAEDASGNLSPHSNIITSSSRPFICGDINNDGIITIMDIVYFINFKYYAGPEPAYLESADVNNDGIFNILDLVDLIKFKYKNGPALNCPDEFIRLR